MNALKAVLSRFVGLFVDDGRFAGSIVLWLAVNWLVVPRLGIGSAWAGVVLFAGFALILMVDALRRVRRTSGR